MKKLILSISILVLCSCTKTYTCQETKSIDGDQIINTTYDVELDKEEIESFEQEGNFVDTSFTGNILVGTRMCN